MTSNDTKAFAGAAGGTAEALAAEEPTEEQLAQQRAELRAKRREQGDALVESAKRAVDKAKEHLTGAELGLTRANEKRAALEERLTAEEAS